MIHPHDPPAVDFTRLATNEFLADLKKRSVEVALGLDGSPESYKFYLETITKANDNVNNDPSILDQYAFPITTPDHLVEIPYPTSVAEAIRFFRKHAQPTISLYDKVLYYRANPWLFAHECITPEVIERTTQSGVSFTDFIPIQKIFLRDFMDPRIPKMIACCCRGGSKTFLVAVGCVISQALIPKCRVTVLGGSGDQADNLYNKYFTKFIDETPLVNLLTGPMTQRMTRFLHGGFMRSLKASEKSVRGPRVDIYLLDEACSADPRIIQSSFGSVWTARNIKIIWTSTPDKMAHPFHYKFKIALDTVPPNSQDWKKYKWTMHDCPWISASNIEQAEREYDTAMFRKEVMAEFGSQTKSVFPLELLEQADVPDYPEYIRHWMDTGLNSPDATIVVENVAIGIDWGVAHKACAVVAALTSDNKCYIVDSYGASGLRPSTFRDKVIGMVHKYTPTVILCDSENVGERMELNQSLMDTGVTAYPISFNKYKHYRMIPEVRKRLEKGTIFIAQQYGHNGHISKSEDGLMEQLMAYEYVASNIEDDSMGNMVSEKTSKRNDDYIDAMMQAVWALRDKDHMLGPDINYLELPRRIGE